VSTPAGRGRRREAAAAPSDPTPLDLMADFSREQFAAAIDASGALFRGVEAMRAIQQQAAQAASARHRSAARDVRATSGAADLFAIPVSLLQGDLAAATRYWQELAAVALEIQTEIIGSACAHVFDAQTALETASAVDALETVAGAGLPLPRPPAAPGRSRRSA
jgi:hypothetical protein